MATPTPWCAPTSGGSRRSRVATAASGSCAPPWPASTDSARSTPLLADDTVDEVLVNAHGDVWVERDGRIEPAGHLAAGDLAVVTERILAPLGRRLDRTTPIVDARLPDGSRVCAVIPPVVARRRVPVGPPLPRPLAPLDAFAADAVVAVLELLVAGRCNVVVSGATSSGKTSLLNASLGR